MELQISHKRIHMTISDICIVLCLKPNYSHSQAHGLGVIGQYVILIRHQFL